MDLLGWPVCKFLVAMLLEDFAGDSPGGFVWALFAHKNDEKDEKRKGSSKATKCMKF